MRIAPSSKNRLCIYFFYDKQGIVDEYVFVMLREMQKYVTTIEFVSNGALQPSSKQALLSGGVSVMERSNEGFDVWAYRYALMKYGWQKLSLYDEVILMNFTIVGPVGSFVDMFTTMDEKDLDFWGITVHYGENYDPWNKLKGGGIPKHIQSHFIAVRRDMLESEDFQRYWEDMCPINSYTDAIAYHEAIFTGHFESLGFQWEAYVQADDLEPLVSYPLMFVPHIMLERKACPIIKRKSFLLTMDDIGGNGCGDLNCQLLDSLQRLNFDIRPIMTHLIRSGDQLTLRSALGSYYFVPETQQKQTVPFSGERYLVVARIEDIVLASLFDNYLQSMVEYADVHIKTSEKQVFHHYKEMENPNVALTLYSDKPSFRECMENESQQYPWVCFLGFCDPWTRGEKERCLPHIELCRLILESLLKSREQVLGQLASGMIPYYYGLLMPPTPIHAAYMSSTIWTWLGKQSEVVSLLRDVGIDAKIDENSIPYAPIGGSFWVRQDILDGLSALYLHGKHEDVEDEFVLMQALPFLVQRLGVLCAQVCNTNIAQYYVNLLSNKFSNRSLLPTKPEWREDIYHKCEFFLNADVRTNTQEAIERRVSHDTEEMTVQFVVPSPTKEIRFDPDGGYSLICKGAVATKNGEATDIVPINGFRSDDMDIFITQDPQYRVAGPFAKGDELVISIKSVQRIDQYDFVPLLKHKPAYVEPLQAALSDLMYNYECQKNKCAGYKEELNIIYTSKAWKVMQFFTGIIDFFRFRASEKR